MDDILSSFVKSKINSDIPIRIRSLLDINSGYVINKINLISSEHDFKDAEIDGELIAEILITQHGLSLTRFATLSLYQREYSETLICSTIQHLCNHLDKISKVSASGA